MNVLKKTQWSPHVAGALVGVVSWFSVFAAGKYLGVSTTFVRTIGMIESLFTPERVASLPYFIKEKSIIDWQCMEVLGILIGAFIASKLSRICDPCWNGGNLFLCGSWDWRTQFEANCLGCKHHWRFDLWVRLGNVGILPRNSCWRNR